MPMECAMNPACTAEVPCPTGLLIQTQVGCFHSVDTPIGRAYVKLWDETSEAAHPQSSDSDERASMDGAEGGAARRMSLLQALMRASSAVTTAAPVANRRLRLPALVEAGVRGTGTGTTSAAGL